MKLISSTLRFTGCREKTWLADDDTEITADFDTESAPGSKILVVGSGNLFVKNCKGQWQKFGTNEIVTA